MSIAAQPPHSLTLQALPEQPLHVQATGSCCRWPQPQPPAQTPATASSAPTVPQALTLTPKLNSSSPLPDVPPETWKWSSPSPPRSPSSTEGHDVHHLNTPLSLSSCGCVFRPLSLLTWIMEVSPPSTITWSLFVKCLLCARHVADMILTFNEGGN